MGKNTKAHLGSLEHRYNGKYILLFLHQLGLAINEKSTISIQQEEFIGIVIESIIDNPLNPTELNQCLIQTATWLNSCQD